MASSKTSWKALQRHRVIIARVIWLLLFLYLFVYLRQPVKALTSVEGMVGIALIGLGVLVRSLSAGMLHKNEQIANHGIYGMVRNPLYFGSLLLLVGINVLIANPVAWVVSLLLFLITYIPTILGEEAGLAKAFGDQWVAYKQSTPRLLPNPLKIGELRHTSWNARQWYRNHEHNTILAALAILALLYAYNRYWAIQ
jgi:protein-S-isoprenylcysteine O-methyltransferase Ste14